MATNAPTRVKKLFNAIEDIVPESLRGLAGGAPRPGQGRPEPESRPPRRRAEAGQGRPDLGRRLRSRTAPWRLRRPGHARRGGRRQCLHVAGARPDGGRDPRRRRRRWRPAHRQELHRRRAELPARGRARRRRHRGRDRRHQRRRGGPGLALYGRAPWCRRHRPAREDRRRPCRGRRIAGRGGGDGDQGQ